MGLGRILERRAERTVHTGPFSIADPIEAWVRDMAGTRGTFVASDYACRRLIADNVAKMPLRAHRRNAGGVKVEVDPPLVLTEPPPRWPTTYDWVFALVDSVAAHGNGIGLPRGVDPATGRPLSVELIPPHRVRIADEQPGEPLQWRIDGQPWDDDLLHVPLCPSSGTVWSPSPTQTFRNVLDLGSHAVKYTSDYFAAGGHPSYVLAYDGKPATDEEASKLVDLWKRKTANREPIAMAKLTDVHRFQDAPELADDALQWVVNEVARIYAIPVEMIGGRAGTGLTYSNREQRKLEFIDLALDTYIARLERLFTDRLAARGTVISFDIQAVTRTDRKSRLEADKVAVDSGTTSINEIRALRGDPPVPGGDDPVVSAASLRDRASVVLMFSKIPGMDMREVLDLCGFPGLSVDMVADLDAEAALLAESMETIP